MNKNFLQDVIPSSHKRSIKDIPLPKHKQTTRTARPVAQREEDYEYVEPALIRTTPPVVPEQDSFEHASPITSKVYSEKPLYNSEELHAKTENSRADQTYQTSNPRPVFSKNKKRTGKKIILAGFALGFIAILFVIFGKQSAVITMKAKQSNYAVSTSIVLDTPTSIVTKSQITKTASKTIPATQEQQIEQAAQGKIRIINKHKEEPQELVTNTRFQAPNGLIYRIRQPIEIPGYKMVNGTMVPGTLEVEVYADSTGEEYNISNTTFTIPGFQKMEQFDKITAETIGDITGGYIGIRKVVTAETKSTIEAELKQELQNQINNASKESTEYVLIPDMSTLAYSDTKDEASGNSVTLTITASVSTHSIPKQAFADFVGQNTVPGATPQDSFVIENPNSLTFTLEEKVIEVKGETLIMWNVDIEKLKTEVAGKKRSEMQGIVDKYNSFESLVISEINPKWSRTISEDTSKITIEIVK